MNKPLRTFSGWAAKLVPFSLLKLADPNAHIFPFYHTVSDEPIPYLNHLYPIYTVKRFREELEFLLRHYRPLTLDEMFTISRGHPVKGDRPGFFLTFDDGLREISEIVAPILEGKGLEAIFFVNPAFVDNKAMFYRHKTNLLINALDKSWKSLPIREIAASLGCQAEDLVRRLRSHDRIPDAALDSAAETTGVDFGRILRETKPYLDLNELKELKEKGFLIGSHSFDHPEFSKLDDDGMKEQLTLSFEWLERNLSISGKLFSFPFTDYAVPDRFFRWMYDELGVTISFGTAGIKKERYTQHLQRIPMEHQRLLSARQILKEEYAWYHMKSWAGKNVIKRK